MGRDERRRKDRGLKMSEKIKMTDQETKEEIEITVVEQTRINNHNYLLVTEEGDEDDETAYILKDLSKDTDEEAEYVILEDDEEIDYVSRIFEELLEDVEIQ